MKIDLQIHSTFSDGCYTPSELVALGKKHGLSLMAITDHDTTSGVVEAMRVGVDLGVKVIPGVEITTMLRDKTIHILGYHFDIENRVLQELLVRLREDRKRIILEKVVLINEQLALQGRTLIDLDDFLEFCSDNFCVGKTTLYMAGRGIVKNRDEANEYFWATKKVAHSVIHPSEAIRVIHDAGGVAVFSHPFAPKISLKNITEDFKEQKEIIKELKIQGLDGLECYQACHGEEDTQNAFQVAKELDLIRTVGSDWHGPIAVTGQHILSYIPYYVDMIGDIAVPDEVTEKLTKLFS